MMYLGNPVTVSSTMVIWAFRYCLGRRSYAVSDCVENILNVWDELEPKDRRLIVDEIIEAQQAGQLGMKMDKEQWLLIVKRFMADREKNKGSKS